MPTLAALVPGAMAGVVSEVLVADGGSRDDTVAVAEVAGCNVTVVELNAGAPTGSWRRRGRARLGCCSCAPGTVLDTPWTGDAERFVEQALAP